jgi:hypothetical protein
VAVAPGEHDERIARATGLLEKLVKRLQSLSAPAWTSRRDPILVCLARLVELNALAEGQPMPELPELASFALADAIMVITGDVLAAHEEAPNGEVLDLLLVELDSALAATR